jgi:hypothetical protein
MGELMTSLILTEIKDGERIWTKEKNISYLISSGECSIHYFIYEGLKEVLREEPINLGTHLVFELEPIIIELHEKKEEVRLLSETQHTAAMSYCDWGDLFIFIRQYWKKSRVSE